MRALLRNNYLSIVGLFKNPTTGIHILNSHFTLPELPKEYDKIIFKNFLSFLDQRCKLISIQEATHMIGQKLFPSNECMVAFTFDDGFEECYTTIAPVLEEFGCNAAFFINANYIESEIPYQIKFHKRINTFTKKPMSWEQLQKLHYRGHVIGSHTLDHLNLALLSPEEVDYQLKINKNILENKLNYNCDYFAWTYGQLKHFPETVLKQTKKYHKHIFSGTNYKRYFSYNGQVINRRHIEPYWPKNHIKYFLSTNKKE